MCGRYSFSTSKEKVKKQFGIEIRHDLELSYNIAPTQKAYVLTNTYQEQFQRFRWGLIPHWANSSQVGNNLINARMEGISSKPSFRMPIRKRRCLVVADSFYEWRREGLLKIPYRILPASGQLLVMAGIWDVWLGPDQEMFKTFAIITTPPNAEMEPVHNRMPALLQSPDEQEAWLGDFNLESTPSLLRPAEDGMLKMYSVSDLVNSPRNNFEELHKPVDPPKNLTLFDVPVGK